MLRSVLSHYALKPALLALIFTVPSLTGAQAATRNVVIGLNHPASTNNLKAFRVYLNNVPVCETLDTTAREISCPVTLANGPNQFAIEAVYNKTSPPSTPTVNTSPVGQELVKLANEGNSSNLLLKTTAPANIPLTYASAPPEVSSTPSAVAVPSPVVSPTPNGVRNVVINWKSQASPNQEVLAFQVYQNGVFLCETLDKTARQLTCPVTLAENRNVFNVQTVYGQTAQASNSPTKTASSATLQESRSSKPQVADSAAKSLPENTSATQGHTNQVPLSSNMKVTVNEDGSVKGYFTATSVDSAQLTYLILSDPKAGKVELLDPTTGEFLYTPAPDMNGQDSFSYSASSGAATSSPATVSVDILPVNDPTVADAGPDQTVNEGETVSIDATNSYDIDDAISSVNWTQIDGPLVTLSDPTSGQPKFESVDVVGTDSVTLTFQATVTDASGAQSTDTSLVNVVRVNTPAVADAGSDQLVFEGETVTLDASNSFDSDNDGIAAYSWKQIAGTPVSLSDTTAKQPSLIAPNVESDSTSLVYELTVADSGGLLSRDTAIINVTKLNTPPIADAGHDQAVSTGATVMLDGTLSLDSDDGISSIQWRQTAGVPVTLSNPTDLQPTFPAPATSSEPITLTFELLVKDIGGLQHTDSCSVEVLP